MEAEVGHLGLDEELLPPARRLERELHGEFLLGLGNLLQKRPERGRHRNGKRTGLSAFRRREGDLVLGEIDTAHGDAGFAEATAGVKRDFEGGLHPLGFLGKCRLDRHNFRVSELRFLRGLVLSEREADQGVAFGVPQPHGFPDDHRKRLELEDRGVPSNGLPAFLFVGRPPVDVSEYAPVGDVQWQVEFPDLEPEGDPLMMVFIMASQR